MELQKVKFLKSTSPELHTFVRGKSIHINAHGSIHTDPPIYTVIPEQMHVRFIGPFGSLLLGKPTRTKQLKDMDKRIRQIDRELYALYEKSKNSQMITIQRNLSKVFSFKYTFDNVLFFSFEEWYDAVFSFSTEPLNSFVNRYSPTFSTLKLLVHYVNKHIDRKLDKYIHLKWSRLVQKHVKEVSDEYNKKIKDPEYSIFFLPGDDESKLRGLVPRLINTKPLFIKLTEIVKQNNSTNDKLEKQYDALQHERITIIDEYKKHPQYLSQKVIYESALYYETNPREIPFTFRPGSIVPDVVFGGRRRGGELFETYFTIFMIDHNVPTFIHITDLEYSKSLYSFVYIMKIFSGLDVTFTVWSCLGFDMSFPEWYNNNTCLGNPLIGGRRRSMVSSAYEHGRLSYEKITKVKRITPDLIVDTISSPIVPRSYDFEIERNLSLIRWGELSNAFLNTFREVDIVQDIQEFYRGINISRHEPVSRLYYIIEEYEPYINDVLRFNNFYLEITFEILYNIFKTYSYSDKLKPFIFNEYIFNLYRIPKHIYQRRKRRRKRRKRNQFGIPNPFEFRRRYQLENEGIFVAQPLKPSSEYSDIDYVGVMICIVSLLSKHIVNGLIDIEGAIKEHGIYDQSLGSLVKQNSEYKIAKFLVFLDTTRFR